MNTKHLKAKILDLAIRGKLVPQDPLEGNAADLLKKIREEKAELIKQKKVKADKNSSFIIKADDGKHYEQFADGTLKDIEDEIPFEIPESWCWVRLRDIGIYKKGPFGSALTKAMFVPKSDSTIKVYEQQNAIKKNHELGHYYIKRDYFESDMKGFEVHPGDIIVSCAGTIGETYILPENIEKGIINQALMKMTITNKLNIQFFLMYFDHILKTASDDSGKGTAMKNIPPFDIFKQFLFPLPPLSEQQRIVSAIEKAFEQIDIIEKNKLSLKTYIKQTKSKVLDLAIHGKLVKQNPSEGNAFELLEKIRKEKSDLIKQKKLKEDKKSSFIIKAEDGKHYEQFADGSLKNIEDEIPFEIPENWCWCRLREIGNWQSGCTPDKSRKDFYDKADIPWLNSGDLTDGYIENIPHYVSRIAFNEKKMKLNDAGSVCIAMYGATIGKLGILTKPATTNQAVLVCNKLHLSDSKFLFYFLKSHKKEYIQAGFGGAQPNISKEKVEPTLFPLPPLDEQKRIVDRIEQIFEQLDILEKALGE